MANLFYSLPIELTREIYDFDPTYKEKLDVSLRLIEHGMEKCTCGGKAVTLSSCYFHVRMGYTPCLKHYMVGLFDPNIEALINPNEYERLFNTDEGYTYNYNGFDIEVKPYVYRMPQPYYQSMFSVYKKYILYILRVYISQKSIKIINNKKRRQGRFMDMGHYQRREV
tara:strand:+ start:260 stop:763 length:504 start_codon:yes stop_codon:yes gene_type:complete